MEANLKRRHFLREWRQYKRLSLRRLAATLAPKANGDTLLSHASLSRIEAGHQDYTEKLLNALADEYGIDPWMLLHAPPEKGGAVIELFVRLDPAKQKQAIKLIEVLKAG